MQKSATWGGPKSPVHSVLLSKAFNRFRSELKNDYDPIVDVASMEELLAQTKAIEPTSSRSSMISSSLNRLEPILSHINNFAAVIAVASGADAKATGLVWGSLKVILMLATPAGDALDDVLNMLDQMSLSLPRFHSYEENLPMSPELESALLEVYTEMTCFCARTINFFRCHPHRPLMRLDWPKFDGDFSHTMMRIERLSKAVDAEADAIRLRADANRNTELLAAISLMKEKPVKESNLPCYHVPFGLNEAFYGRDEIISQMKEALDPKEGDFRPKSLALYGMGGVGKTQIARHYADSSRELYDAIFWVSADSSIKMTQDFLEIGQKLGLVADDGQVKNPAATMLKVKSWLTQTKCRWLLVFDNADDLSILQLAWPGSAAGSICLTSRDLTAGQGIATTGIHIQPFDDSTGASTFLQLIGRSSSDTDLSLATQICHNLGGLPLALRQISGFITQQRLSLKDFVPLYERNSAKIHTRKGGVTDYEHTLATCWELALGHLSESAYSLQKLLAFFDPDNIDESILVEGSNSEDGKGFEYLNDDMDFMDAKEQLLRSALVDRSQETASLSVHRLVQVAVMNKMSAQERQKFLDQALKILFAIFPDSWRSGPGYVYGSWSKCEVCLPHVQFLVAQNEKYKIGVTDPQGLVDLLLRCSWYLYESERFDRAQSLLNTTLSILPDKNGLTFGRATNLLGLTYLDTNQPKKALECFQTALTIRKALLSPDDAFIASSLSNVSLAHTELNQLDQSMDYQQQAIDIRLKTHSDLIGNSYSNMSSCLLRMGKADEAEEILLRCPSLKDMTDETFLRADNLRFTSDMVLLSRIRQKQGRSDDALRLASKALEFRQKNQGNRFKTCDGFYQVASMLHDRGDNASALNLLERCADIAKSLPDAEGYLARAWFKQAEVYRSIGDEGRWKSGKDDAEALKLKLVEKGVLEQGSMVGYEGLVPWMLW